MTARKSARRKTTRKPAPQSFGEQVDAAVAGTTARGFAWLGRSLVGLVALILWPIRLWLIMLGAGIGGFCQGARDEYRLIREEWREDRDERHRLGNIIEAEWDRLGLTSAEARDREVGRRRDELYRAGLEAIERDQARSAADQQEKSRTSATRPLHRALEVEGTSGDAQVSLIDAILQHSKATYGETENTKDD